jgi:outer membrane immunogenic protein
VGVHGGYAIGEHEGVGTYADPVAGPLQVLDPIENSLDTDGWFGGLQAGYNLQHGSIVYGIEGDVSWGDISGDGTFISDDGNNGTTDYTWHIKTEYDWLATLRGRVGFLIKPNLLIYGTGGVAWARTTSDETVTGFPPQGFNPPQVTVLASAEEDHVGWVLGAGGEWLLHHGWSLKAEWQHIDFGDADTRFSGTAYPGTAPCRGAPAAGCQFAYNQDSFPGSLDLDTFRVGLNYKFGAREERVVPLK